MGRFIVPCAGFSLFLIIYYMPPLISSVCIFLGFLGIGYAFDCQSDEWALKGSAFENLHAVVKEVMQKLHLIN